MRTRPRALWSWPRRRHRRPKPGWQGRQDLRRPCNVCEHAGRRGNQRGRRRRRGHRASLLRASPRWPRRGSPSWRHGASPTRSTTSRSPRRRNGNLRHCRPHNRCGRRARTRLSSPRCEYSEACCGCHRRFVPSSPTKSTKPRRPRSRCRCRRRGERRAEKRRRGAGPTPKTKIATAAGSANGEPPLPSTPPTLVSTPSSTRVCRRRCYAQPTAPWEPCAVG
mmetsp:Transcript_18638/g.53420  ORF Transcript_18638/g.53420 Transcript_18638/m.53420 type:complete len:222 (+) Transcript_18638:1119-1784(+)